MKKTFVTILLAVLFVAAVAVAEDALLNAAWSLVPADAVLTEQEADDGLYEYDFRSDAARYEVLLDKSGAAVLLKTEYAGVKGGDEAVLDASAAEAAVLARADAGAAVDFSLLVQDDRRWFWTVFVVSGTDLAEYELNAQTGEMVDAEVYYGASAGVLPSAFAAQLAQEKGSISLTDLELECDDGKLVYTGNASMDGKRYEFEALASDGKLIEWEKD